MSLTDTEITVRHLNANTVVANRFDFEKFINGAQESEQKAG